MGLLCCIQNCALGRKRQRQRQRQRHRQESRCTNGKGQTQDLKIGRHLPFSPHSPPIPPISFGRGIRDLVTNMSMRNKGRTKGSVVTGPAVLRRMPRRKLVHRALCRPGTGHMLQSWFVTLKRKVLKYGHQRDSSSLFSEAGGGLGEVP